MLPFYLTEAQVQLYEQDIYKYLIHLLKIFPTDEFHILQFLLLQFHPLVIRVCRKYHARNIQLDWTDLISFTRYSFTELVYRFNLNSTLYFKTFIPLALDRAVNDYQIYDMRRKELLNAARLDQMSTFERDVLIQQHTDLLNQDNKESEYQQDDLADYRDECLHYVESHTELGSEEKDVFIQHFLNHKDLMQIAKEKELPLDTIRRKLGVVLEEVKHHLKENFL